MLELPPWEDFLETESPFFVFLSLGLVMLDVAMLELTLWPPVTRICSEGLSIDCCSIRPRLRGFKFVYVFAETSSACSSSLDIEPLPIFSFACLVELCLSFWTFWI